MSRGTVWRLSACEDPLRSCAGGAAAPPHLGDHANFTMAKMLRRAVAVGTTVDGGELRHQLMAGLSMFIPVSIGAQPSFWWSGISFIHCIID